MPQPSAAQHPAAQAGAHPQTLETLAAAHQVAHLDADLGTVALLGAHLHDALVSTRNSAALITGVGGFAGYQDTTRPFHLSQNRMTLRVDTTAPVHVVRHTAQAGQRTVLCVADAKETIVMRAETGSRHDLNVLSNLQTRGKHSHPPADLRTGGGVVSLAAVRQARASWAQRDSGQHLNALMAEGGTQRASTLPHIGKGRALKIRPEVLPSFLTYLVARQIRHARLVMGCGFCQGDIFENGAIEQLDTIVLVSQDATNFALDLTQVSRCWVTRFAQSCQLEIYGADDRPVAVLAADPHSNLGQWHDLLAALPAV
ncbi:MAG: hypothetical protein AAF943_15500 [Pseudomonadota bacterium]